MFNTHDVSAKNLDMNTKLIIFSPLKHVHTMVAKKENFSIKYIPKIFSKNIDKDK